MSSILTSRSVLVLFFMLITTKVFGNFNLFVDKEEFHRITGGTLSQLYLVRDGVVNEYALGYVMNIPFHIQHLNFKWIATNKKPVHYEMLIEFSDFFALLQPTANISKVGRLPHKLETFRVSFPCSGRLTTEVPVIIRFTFHVKHSTKNGGQDGHNITHVNVKRNKICLLKENYNQISQQDTKHDKENKMIDNNSTLSDLPPLTNDNLNSPPTTPSLLLAGLLGACAITASVGSVVFFICLKKRLQKLDDQNINGSNSIDSYNTNSPACLIKHYNNEPNQAPPPPPPNYSTLQSFWGKENNFKNEKLYQDVSPYAYAQIIRPQQQPWFHNSGHIYANQLSSFGQTDKNSEIYSNYNKSLGSSSLIQIDGFQCPKSFTKEKNVVERFL